MNRENIETILKNESLKHRVVLFTTRERAYFRLKVNDWSVNEGILFLYQNDTIAARIPINNILNLWFYD